MGTDTQEKIEKLSKTAAQSEKYNVVFVLGPPGSGKGTQCQGIEEVIFIKIFKKQNLDLWLHSFECW